MLITKLFKHTQVQPRGKQNLQSKVDHWFFQEHVGYCSVCKAVDGTHFVRNLISDVTHQDRYSIISDLHYRARKFYLYLELWSIF